MNLKILKYVRNYVEENFKVYCDRLSKVKLDEIVHAISLDLSKKYTYQQVLDNSLDKVIHGAVTKTFKFTEPNLHADQINFENYIRQMTYDLGEIKYSDSTLKLIKNRVLDILMNNYTYNQLMEGKADKEFRLIFKRVEKDLRNEIREYVCNYIVSNVFPYPLGVDQVEIANKMVRRIMESKKYSASDLFKHKYDKIIKEYVEAAPKKKDTKSKNVNTTVDYPALMRENSVANDRAPQKVKHKTKKKKTSKTIIALVLVAVLAAGVGKIVLDVGGFFVDKAVSLYDDIKNRGAKDAVDEFDPFEYSDVFTRIADAVRPMALNSVDFAKKLMNAGYENMEYRYLGFYRAYDHVKKDRLYIMDYMLELAKLQTMNDDSMADFYDSIKDCSCYLDFVYDRLEAMGFSEISDVKYTNALYAYEEAIWEHIGVPPMNVIDAESAELIHEVMAKYREYSERYLVDFGNNFLVNKELAKSGVGRNL